MKKVTSFLWVGLLMVAMLILPLQANAETTGVNISVAKDTTMKSSDNGYYSVGNVSELSKTCNVTVTTSNKDVVALVQGEKVVDVDSVTLTGEKQELDRKGKWSTTDEAFDNGWCDYVAMGPGEAVITVTVTDTSDATAEPLAKSFTVKVTKSTPKVTLDGKNIKNLKKISMWTNDGALWFDFINISNNATITVKCNKDNVFREYLGGGSKGRKIKKNGTVYTSDTLTLMAQKAGKFKLTFTLTQDGSTYTYPLTVTVKKYVNPISNLTINNKNYASGFDKHAYLGEGAELGRGAELGFYNYQKGTFKSSLTLKKGYSLEGVYWAGKKLKTTKSNGKYSFTINTKKDQDTTLQFILKDKKGNRLTLWSSYL